MKSNQMLGFIFFTFFNGFSCSTNFAIRRQIWSETLPADNRIMGITEVIKPHVEKEEETSYTEFNAISYYAGNVWRSFDRTGRTLFIKVTYDLGIMHIKVKEVLLRFGTYRLYFEGYQIGRELHEIITPF